jgi:hypothetical protein
MDTIDGDRKCNSQNGMIFRIFPSPVYGRGGKLLSRLFNIQANMMHSNITKIKARVNTVFGGEKSPLDAIAQPLQRKLAKAGSGMFSNLQSRADAGVKQFQTMAHEGRNRMRMSGDQLSQKMQNQVQKQIQKNGDKVLATGLQATELAAKHAQASLDKRLPQALEMGGKVLEMGLNAAQDAAERAEASLHSSSPKVQVIGGKALAMALISARGVTKSAQASLHTQAPKMQEAGLKLIDKSLQASQNAMTSLAERMIQKHSQPQTPEDHGPQGIDQNH